MSIWSPDFLDGYESTDLLLPGAVPAPGEPVDVELVATLIRRKSSVSVDLGAGSGTQAVDPPEPRQPAVLYLHGWNDYFFQTHLADHFDDLGFAFYALDLRRYGRSLRRGHLAGFITDLDDYGTEIGLAADLIALEHDSLVLMGHSTGGLIASLWAAKNPDRVDALVLNSPWLDLQGSALVKTLGTPVIDALGSRAPTSVIRLPDLGFYARTVHIDLGGEWDYDRELKTSPSPPLRAGWLRAVLLGHQRVAAGLGIEVPILVLASTLTNFGRKWSEDLRTADTVLDVEQIAARAVRLGRHVTVVRVTDGLHDLILSAPHVRKETLDEISRFLRGYLTVRTK